jgi:hypothetical protein
VSALRFSQSRAVRPSSSRPVRAQKHSVTKLNQHKKADQARVSANQLSREQHKKYGATTSISHVIANKRDAAKTTVGRSGHIKRSVFDAGWSGDRYGVKEDSELANRRRYAYIRKMIKERKQAQDLAKKEVATGGPYTLKVKTGNEFKRTGLGGFDKKIKKFFKKHKRGIYQHVDKKDQEYFKSLVSGYAKKRPTGGTITARDKKYMKRDVYKKYKSGVIKKNDMNDFKKIIDNLQN